MERHVFYSMYANTIISARTQPIEVTKKVKKYCPMPVPETLTLSDVYAEVSRLDDLMLGMRCRQDALIEMGSKQMADNQASKITGSPTPKW